MTLLSWDAVIALCQTSLIGRNDEDVTGNLVNREDGQIQRVHLPAVISPSFAAQQLLRQLFSGPLSDQQDAPSLLHPLSGSALLAAEPPQVRPPHARKTAPESGVRQVPQGRSPTNRLQDRSRDENFSGALAAAGAGPGPARGRAAPLSPGAKAAPTARMPQRRGAAAPAEGAGPPDLGGIPSAATAKVTGTSTGVRPVPVRASVPRLQGPSEVPAPPPGPSQAPTVLAAPPAAKPTKTAPPRAPGLTGGSRAPEPRLPGTASAVPLGGADAGAAGGVAGAPAGLAAAAGHATQRRPKNELRHLQQLHQRARKRREKQQKQTSAQESQQRPAKRRKRVADDAPVGGMGSEGEDSDGEEPEDVAEAADDRAGCQAAQEAGTAPAGVSADPGGEAPAGVSGDPGGEGGHQDGPQVGVEGEKPVPEADAAVTRLGAPGVADPRGVVTALVPNGAAGAGADIAPPDWGAARGGLSGRECSTSLAWGLAPQQEVHEQGQAQAQGHRLGQAQVQEHAHVQGQGQHPQASQEQQGPRGKVRRLGSPALPLPLALALAPSVAAEESISAGDADGASAAQPCGPLRTGNVAQPPQETQPTVPQPQVPQPQVPQPQVHQPQVPQPQVPQPQVPQPQVQQPQVQQPQVQQPQVQQPQVQQPQVQQPQVPQPQVQQPQVPQPQVPQPQVQQPQREHEALDAEELAERPLVSVVNIRRNRNLSGLGSVGVASLVQLAVKRPRGQGGSGAAAVAAAAAKASGGYPAAAAAGAATDAAPPVSQEEEADDEEAARVMTGFLGWFPPESSSAPFKEHWAADVAAGLSEAADSRGGGWGGGGSTAHGPPGAGAGHAAAARAGSAAAVSLPAAAPRGPLRPRTVATIRAATAAAAAVAAAATTAAPPQPPAPWAVAGMVAGAPTGGTAPQLSHTRAPGSSGGAGLSAGGRRSGGGGGGDSADWLTWAQVDAAAASVVAEAGGWNSVRASGTIFTAAGPSEGLAPSIQSADEPVVPNAVSMPGGRRGAGVPGHAGAGCGGSGSGAAAATAATLLVGEAAAVAKPTAVEGLPRKPAEGLAVPSSVQPPGPLQLRPDQQWRSLETVRHQQQQGTELPSSVADQLPPARLQQPQQLQQPPASGTATTLRNPPEPPQHLQEQLQSPQPLQQREQEQLGPGRQLGGEGSKPLLGKGEACTGGAGLDGPSAASSSEKDEEGETSEDEEEADMKALAAWVPSFAASRAGTAVAVGGGGGGGWQVGGGDEEGGGGGGARRRGRGRGRGATGQQGRGTAGQKQQQKQKPRQQPQRQSGRKRGAPEPTSGADGVTATGQQQQQQQQQHASGGGGGVEVGLYAEVKAFQRQQRKARALNGGGGGPDSTRPVPEIRGPTACKFWRLGRCSKGADCTFAHVGEPVTRLLPCRFHRLGRCTRGNACGFSHDSGLPEPCRVMAETGTCPDAGRCPLGHYSPEDMEALHDYFTDVTARAAYAASGGTAGTSAAGWGAGENAGGGVAGGLSPPDAAGMAAAAAAAAAAPPPLTVAIGGSTAAWSLPAAAPAAATAAGWGAQPAAGVSILRPMQPVLQRMINSGDEDF